MKIKLQTILCTIKWNTADMFLTFVELQGLQFHFCKFMHEKSPPKKQFKISMKILAMFTTPSRRTDVPSPYTL